MDTRFIVGQENRNRGIGKELLEIASAYLKERNAGELGLKQDYLENVLKGFTK